jgi:hypothetical protein
MACRRVIGIKISRRCSFTAHIFLGLSVYDFYLCSGSALAADHACRTGILCIHWLVVAIVCLGVLAIKSSRCIATRRAFPSN